MTTVNNLKELKETKELKYGDVVVFHIREHIQVLYTVKSTFLSNLDGDESNDKIFQILGIGNRKQSFAREKYGYIPAGGDWPYFNTNDFKGLTKLIEALYKKIGDEYIIEEDKKENNNNEEVNRFELMDIEEE